MDTIELSNTLIIDIYCDDTMVEQLKKKQLFFI